MTRRTRLWAPVLLASLTILAACGNGDGATSDGDTLIVYVGRNENLVKPLIDDYAKESGVKLEVKYGDTSELLPTILEEGDNVRADVFLSQDAGALGALATEGLLAELPQSVLDLVDERFRDGDGRWVGVTGRARVIAYNTTLVKEADLPDSVLSLAEPRWKGKIGFAPTNASFIAHVSALRETVGDDKTRAFIQGLKDNGAKRYDGNVQILDAVANGEVEVGLVNHYYLYNEFKERPGAPVANFYPGQKSGEGTFINVTGAGVIKGTKRQAQAEAFVRFLLGKQAQEYFRDEVSEYPLATGVAALPALPPLDQLKSIDVPLTRLGRDLDGTLQLLKDVGLT